MSFTYYENAAGDPSGQFVAERDDGVQYATDSFGGELWEVDADGTRFRLKTSRQFYAEDLQDFQSKLATALGLRTSTAVRPGRITPGRMAPASVPNEEADANADLARRAAKVTKIQQVLHDKELFAYMSMTEPGRLNHLFATMELPKGRSKGRTVVVAQNSGRRQRHNDLTGTLVIGAIAAPTIIGMKMAGGLLRAVLTPNHVRHRRSR